MGVGLELEDFNKLFYVDTKSRKVIVNDLSDATVKDRDRVESLLYTRYKSTDFLSNLPTCECTKTTGEFALNSICPHCGTHVMNMMERNMEPLVWMRAPKGVTALVNPNFWIMLTARFKWKGYDIIQWLCDTTYKPARKIPEELVQVQNMMKAMKIDRGYNTFVKYFDDIIAGLLSLKMYRKGPKAKKEEIDSLPQLIERYRSCLFSDYIPLPNRALIVLEDTNLGTYADPTTDGAVDAMQDMVNIDSALNNYSVRTKENRTIKAIIRLAGFYSEFYAKRIAPKEGMFRKHVYGSRSHFSFRGVISSLTNRHSYDEIHLPWGIAVSVLQVHLMNKLLRMAWSPNEIMSHLYKYSQKHCPILARLFKELIEESPYPGIPQIFQRNPSLERASAQAVFITRVKDIAEVPTISMSILSCPGYNADFDGKQDCRRKTLLIGGESLYALSTKLIVETRQWLNQLFRYGKKDKDWVITQPVS